MALCPPNSESYNISSDNFQYPPLLDEVEMRKFSGKIREHVGDVHDGKEVDGA